MAATTLQPNTIRHRGLASILEGHLATKNIDDDLKACGVIGEVVYRGAYFEALNTISWFAFGVKP